MLGEFERFCQLPLEVDRQADWYLIPSESGAKVRICSIPKKKTYISLVGISI